MFACVPAHRAKIDAKTLAYWLQDDALPLLCWARAQMPPIDWYPALDLVNAGLVSIVMMPHKRTGKAQRHVQLDSAMVDRLGIVAAARMAGWVRPA